MYAPNIEIMRWKNILLIKIFEKADHETKKFGNAEQKTRFFAKIKNNITIMGLKLFLITLEKQKYRSLLMSKFRSRPRDQKIDDYNQKINILI